MHLYPIDSAVHRVGRNETAWNARDATWSMVIAAIDSDPAKASAIVLNAKMRRTGVCGATETLLIDATYPDPHGLVEPLLDAGCELRGDARAMAIDPRIRLA